jgi:hypothetical protein
MVRVALLNDDIKIIKNRYGLDMAEIFRSVNVEFQEVNADSLSRGGTYPLINFIYAPYQPFYVKYKLLSRFLNVGQFQPPIGLLNKLFTDKILSDTGLPFLPQQRILNKETIENFESEYVVVKPPAETNSTSPLPFAYKVISKQELLDQYTDELADKFYIIQRAITNNKPVLWTTGGVSQNGEFIFDGVIEQYFSIDENHFIDPIKYPSRHVMTWVERKDNFTPAMQSLMDQIRTLFTKNRYFGTPFCIQGMEDDDGTLYLIDFNLGDGKHYSYAAEKNNLQYFIDRFNFLWADGPPNPNQKYHSLMVYQVVSGTISEEVLEHCRLNNIYIDGYTTSYASRDKPICQTTFIAVGDTREEAESRLQTISQFYSPLSIEV